MEPGLSSFAVFRHSQKRLPGQLTSAKSRIMRFTSSLSASKQAINTSGH